MFAILSPAVKLIIYIIKTYGRSFGRSDSQIVGTSKRFIPQVSFTSIPAGQAGTGIASFTPFWLIEKRIHLRGKHAGVFKSG
jgi:hypothetical protein